MTARSLSYNSGVAVHKSVSVGFYATGSVTGPRPAEFRINDQVRTTDCRPGAGASGQSVKSLRIGVGGVFRLRHSRG